MFFSVLSCFKDAQGVFSPKLSISIKSEAAYPRLLAKSPFPHPLLHASLPHPFLRMSMGLTRQSHVWWSHGVFFFFWIHFLLCSHCLARVCFVHHLLKLTFKWKDCDVIWRTPIQDILRAIRNSSNHYTQTASFWALARCSKLPH